MNSFRIHMSRALKMKPLHRGKISQNIPTLQKMHIFTLQRINKQEIPTIPQGPENDPNRPNPKNGLNALKWTKSPKAQNPKNGQQP